MKYFWPILLQALAFAVAMAEVVIPSFGILALLCAALGIYSWYFILKELPPTAAIFFGIADAILIPVGIKLAFTFLGRSPISHRTDLGTGSGLESLDQDLHQHVGRTALVDAPLRPTGKIRLGQDVFEAQTAGDWVERGATVKVVSVSGSRFQVEKI
jgi:membrane-bound ClpP family serine protease